MIYKWLILADVYYTGPLAIAPDPLSLPLALRLVRVTDKDEVLINTL